MAEVFHVIHSAGVSESLRRRRCASWTRRRPSEARVPGSKRGGDVCQGPVQERLHPSGPADCAAIVFLFLGRVRIPSKPLKVNQPKTNAPFFPMATGQSCRTRKARDLLVILLVYSCEPHIHQPQIHKGPGYSKPWKFHAKSGDYQFFEGLSEKTRSFQTLGF